MNSELSTTDTVSAASHTRTAPSRRLGLVSLAVVGLLGLSACTSDPGPKRVAEDIIQTAVVQGDLTQAQGDCMFDRVEQYTDDELKAITDSAADAGPGTPIQMFEADLAACK